MKCPTCGGDMVQKNRPFLVLVGLMMLGSPALGMLGRVFWVPAAGLLLKS